MLTLGLEIAIVVALILFNGMLAMTEMAVVTSRRIRLEQRANEGDGGARAALRMLDEPNRFLSTVQIGITLVGILAGAFGGATIASKLGDALEPRLGESASSVVSVGVVVAGITYLSLVIGELVPKRVALARAETIASRLARPLRLLSLITAPLVAILARSTDLVTTLLRIDTVEEPRISEDELRMLIKEGGRTGVFEPVEEEMLSGVFRLGDRIASDVMTPRPRVTWLDIEEPIDESLSEVADSGHGLIPVCRGSIDEVVGVLPLRDLWNHVRLGGEITRDVIVSLLRPALFVPESKPVVDILEDFRQTGQKLGMVIDEFGGIQGVITVIDALEEIVGELGDYGTPPDAHVHRRDDGSWLVDGLFPFHDFVEQFTDSPHEGAGFATVGGFVLHQLGRIPRPGDSFAWDTLTIEVMDMDGNRVDKLLVTPGAGGDAPEGEPA